MKFKSIPTLQQLQKISIHLFNQNYLSLTEEQQTSCCKEWWIS